MGSQRDTAEGLTLSLPPCIWPCVWAVGTAVTVQMLLLCPHWLMGKPDIQQEKNTVVSKHDLFHTGTSIEHGACMGLGWEGVNPESGAEVKLLWTRHS